MAKPSATKSPSTLPDIKTEIVTITPEVAEDMLGHNVHNRSPRQAKVNEIAGAIERGEWVLNGDAIRFREDGTLDDGQHRLLAIIQANTAVPSLVIHGLPEGAQDTIDLGAKRNLGDSLKLKGYKSSQALAATINYFYRWQIAEQVRTPSVKPTVLQGVALVEAYPGLINSVTEIDKTQRRFHLSKGMLASVHYVLSSIDSDSAEQFFHKLTYGEGLEAGSPILVLRQHLELQAAAGVGARQSALIHHALIIKAWNFWGEGLLVDRITWRSGGMQAEAFPEPMVPKWVK